ncbi:MAG: metallophosphoesterase [Bacteroidetes bacterium]|nr:metallophosphoesterase [Bacteroidota bacterium]
MEIFNMVNHLKKWIYVCLFIANTAAAQNNPFKVYLVGDAGEDKTTGETLKNLGKELVNNPNSVVVFLGDNSYKDAFFGLAPGFKGFDSTKTTQAKLRSQLNILTNYHGYVFFIPGNHDWWNITKYGKGRKKLKMEESFIEANLAQNKTIANPDRTFLPKDGSPGPESIELNDKKIRLIFIDTYRLIITAFKQKQEDDFPIEKAFYHDLDSVMKDATLKHQKIIVTAHHPLYAKGPNTQPLRRPNFFGRIKASNSNFPAGSRMARRLRAIMKKYPGSYYASGHSHSLQYLFNDDKNHYIVSGAGSKTNRVTDDDILHENLVGNDHEYLVWNVKGFFEVDFYDQSEKIFLFHDNGEKKTELVMPFVKKEVD